MPDSSAFSPFPHPTNNGHSPTARDTPMNDAYAPEDLDRLTGAGTFLTWEDLDHETRLDLILSNPDRDAWETPQALDELAYFYPIKAQWLHITSRYRRYKGDPYRLEQAVQQILEAERPAGQAVPAQDGTPLVIALETVQTRPIEWLWYPYM